MINYSYLKALLEYPCNVSVHWSGTDEMQADPIQHTWQWRLAKEELKSLLQQTDTPDKGNSCICFKKHNEKVVKLFCPVHGERVI